MAGVLVGEAGGLIHQIGPAAAIIDRMVDATTEVLASSAEKCR